MGIRCGFDGSVGITCRVTTPRIAAESRSDLAATHRRHKVSRTHAVDNKMLLRCVNYFCRSARPTPKQQKRIGFARGVTLCRIVSTPTKVSIATAQALRLPRQRADEQPSPSAKSS